MWEIIMSIIFVVPIISFCSEGRSHFFDVFTFFSAIFAIIAYFVFMCIGLIGAPSWIIR